jgi:hypothetical protein
MGAETTCAVTFKDKTSAAKVRLETNVLQVRGRDLKLDVPFNTMKKVVAHGGILSFVHAGETLQVAVGAAADRWLDKILHPPSRLTKIGVRPEWRAAIVGHVESAFADELRAAVATLSVGRAVKEADAIFVGISRPSDFERVSIAKSLIKPSGAVWLIRQKGSGEITESAVMAAGRTAGLVDVKVVALSSTHSALKFVIPVKNRRR